MLTEAFLHTKYSNATFAASLPLLPLFGYIFLKEKIKIETLGYILLGFIGLAIVTLKSLSEFTFGYGELMAFGSLILFDLSYVGRKWHTNYLNNYETTVLMFAFGALFLSTTSLLVGETLPTQGQFSVTIVVTLVVAAVFNIANLFLTNYGFEHVKVAVAGNILMLESVFALLYGVFLFNEIPLIKELLGSAIILLSVYLVNRAET
jgi:drug/metabolite transporter (DMT)-like permease